MADSKPFQLLPNEEFNKLTQEQKIAYLRAAIKAVTSRAPVVPVPIPTKGQQEQ